MTLYIRKNSSGAEQPKKFLKEPYITINIILAGVILLMLTYSGFFSPEKDNYPVVCIHEKLTGQPCISCGLSHSFSLVLRGRIREAKVWNPYGLRIFLFFVLEFIMRFVFSMIWIKRTDIRREVVIYDIAGSVVIFIIAFWPFIVNIFSQLTK
jgi:hypothetical protein